MIDRARRRFSSHGGWRLCVWHGYNSQRGGKVKKQTGAEFGKHFVFLVVMGKGLECGILKGP